MLGCRVGVDLGISEERRIGARKGIWAMTEEGKEGKPGRVPLTCQFMKLSRRRGEAGTPTYNQPPRGAQGHRLSGPAALRTCPFASLLNQAQALLGPGGYCRCSGNGGPQTCLPAQLLSTSKGEYHIKFNFRNKSDNFIWSLVAVYGAAQDEFKSAFLKEIVNICRENPHPMILGGISIFSDISRRKTTIGSTLDGHSFLMLLLIVSICGNLPYLGTNIPGPITDLSQLSKN